MSLVGALEACASNVAESGVRVVFGLTTVAVIFVLALVVGALMAGVRTLLARRALSGR